MNRINAYVLAADPTWLEASVRAYYPRVNRIIVSYDRSGRGWTGAPIPVDECVARLRAIDSEKKMEFIAGNFSAPASDPMENDTLQRNTALREAEKNADWVLQLDTDEWLPDVDVFFNAIHRAQTLNLPAVEWPMRVLYRNLSSGRALEVCAAGGREHFEYIAPVAVRSGSTLIHSRRTTGPFLRAVVKGDEESIQLKRPVADGEVREPLLLGAAAIIHNSWARSPAELRRKLASWSHSGPRAWIYYAARWLPSVWFWRWMRDLHPFFGGVWPALRVCQQQLPVRSALPERLYRTEILNSRSSPANGTEGAIQ